MCSEGHHMCGEGEQSNVLKGANKLYGTYILVSLPFCQRGSVQSIWSAHYGNKANLSGSE